MQLSEEVEDRFPGGLENSEQTTSWSSIGMAENILMLKLWHETLVKYVSAEAGRISSC